MASDNCMKAVELLFLFSIFVVLSRVYFGCLHSSLAVFGMDLILSCCVQTDAPKKKVKKVNVPVSETVYGALSPADLQKVVEKEFEMALQDRIMEETKDRKNAVEAYVYDMRNKVCGIALVVSDG